ncbi:MAG: peptidoglycan DD-metalloendopeptidase family protein [Desulfovibrionaceae bacterium]|nr:peptidoglycan DD-metalloendopeptidase family protein [Desulfovibrionaceae bacterium]
MSMSYALNPEQAVNAAAQQDINARRRSIEALSKTDDPAVKRAKLQNACEGFEAIFLQKMWEQMRATLPKDGLTHSKEEEMWQSMYAQELGKSMASAGGIGLADMMMRQLDRTDGAMSDATRQSTVRRAGLNVPPAPLMPPAAASPAPSASAAAQLESAPGPDPAPSQALLHGIYEGEAPQAGESPDEATDAAGAPAAAAASIPGAEADATPASVRQTLDELAARLGVPPVTQAVTQSARSSAGVTSVANARDLPGDAVITRRTYQTNLPPSQRKAALFTGSPDSAANTPYTRAPLSTAASPTGPAQAPGQAGSLPAAPVNPSARATAPASGGQAAAPRPLTPGVPAPEQDILAGITARFVPTGLTIAQTEAAPAGAPRPAAASGEPADPPVQAAGGPALAGPELVMEPVALGNPAPPAGSLEAPVTGGISSGFGWRLDPFTARRTWHAGVDIKAEPGESVRSARSGVVTFAGEHSELGQVVVVDHGDGLRTFYGHNQELSVSAGQRVEAGTELAKAGASGRAAGTHVHFEVRRGDLALNPEPLLRQSHTQVAEAR